MVISVWPRTTCHLRCSHQSVADQPDQVVETAVVAGGQVGAEEPVAVDALPTKRTSTCRARVG